VIEAVVFDFDGTLIDSHPDIADAVNLTLVDLERTARDPAEIRGMIGHGVQHLLSRALETKDEALIGRARARFLVHYEARLVKKTRPFPGIMELLEALRSRGLTLAIATNKPSLFTKQIVLGLGFDRAGIRAFASADEAGQRKPSPRVLELALERAGRSVVPDRVAYVGDMAVDVETAQAFGCRAVGALWGYGPDSFTARKPDVLVESPRELLGWIAR
jgi:phosphoglycolate phosphatase